MVYKSGQIFLPFLSQSTCVTDRQTDGWTEFSSLDRVCIPCSALKTKYQLVNCKFYHVVMIECRHSVVTVDALVFLYCFSFSYFTLPPKFVPVSFM